LIAESNFSYLFHLCSERMYLLELSYNFGNTAFVLFAEDLEEKQQQLQELQLEVERLTAEHANSAETFSGEIDRIVAEGEERTRELQAQFDATLMKKDSEYEKLEGHLTSLQENYAQQVCVLANNIDHNRNSPFSVKFSLQMLKELEFLH